MVGRSFSKLAGRWGLSPRFWKLLLATASLSVALVICLNSFVFSSRIHEQTIALANNWLASIDALSKLRSDLNEARRAEAFIVFGGTCSPTDCFLEIAKRRSSVVELEAYYEKALVSTPEEGVLFRTMLREQSVYFALQDDLLKRSFSAEGIKQAFLSESADAYTNVLRSLTVLNNFNLEGAKGSHDAITSDYSKNTLMMTFLILIQSMNLIFVITYIMFLATNTHKKNSFD